MTLPHQKPVLGIIGGSGLYEIDGLENIRWEKFKSPFGEPSDELMFGQLDGVQLVFLPRHGRGHRLSPSTINYRANIDILKRAGVTDIISLSGWVLSVNTFRPAPLSLLINLLIAPSLVKKVFLAPGWWHTSQWLTL